MHVQPTYEVRVEVEIKGTERCRPINYSGQKRGRGNIWMRTADKVIRMFHIDARTPQQAKQKARKYGRPLTVRKPNVERIVGLSENFKLDETNPYEDALAMDEMIWRKKNKRAERIKTKDKDKNY